METLLRINPLGLISCWWIHLYAWPGIVVTVILTSWTWEEDVQLTMKFGARTSKIRKSWSLKIAEAGWWRRCCLSLHRMFKLMFTFIPLLHILHQLCSQSKCLLSFASFFFSTTGRLRISFRHSKRCVSCFISLNHLPSLLSHWSTVSVNTAPCEWTYQGSVAILEDGRNCWKPFGSFDSEYLSGRSRLRTGWTWT